MKERLLKLAGCFKSDIILIDEPMSRHTTFKIGGPADLMVLPRNIDEITQVISLCHSMELPYFVMGNGSNLLVRDGGIRGVVLKISDNFSSVKINGCNIKVECGAKLTGLAKKCSRMGLQGLEKISGIPGTVGGALAMNAGAYGGEISQVVKNVTCLNLEGKKIIICADDMDFGYRYSILKQNGYIAVETEIQLSKCDPVILNNEISELTRRRREKQPLNLPSAGSAFKRPKGYYAGKLIEDSGLKGFSVGAAAVSTKHAGFVVNNGGASASEVEELLMKIKDIINKKYSVLMENEVKIIGERLHK